MSPDEFIRWQYHFQIKWEEQKKQIEKQKREQKQRPSGPARFGIRRS